MKDRVDAVILAEGRIQSTRVVLVDLNLEVYQASFGVPIATLPLYLTKAIVKGTAK
jgi:hypothetical protein